MRKNLSTIRLELEILGLPKTAKELEEELAHLQFPIQRCIKATQLAYQVFPYFLGKSKLKIDCELICNFPERNAYFLLGESFVTWKRERVSDFLWKILLGLEEVGSKDSPYSIQLPHWKKVLQNFFTEPKRIYLLNLLEVKGKLNTKIPVGWSDGWILNFESGVEIKLRIGHLESIEYLFTKQRFKRPYPKLAECYVRERERWNETSFGDSIWKFRGYLLEKQSDEYLLKYWNLNPQLPDEIRNAIPEEVWQSQEIDTVLVKKYSIELRRESDARFRPVYLVSTSLLDHPI
ncbi:MAG: hypothetical protein O9301_13470 [Leptospira sp.]|nr:hypothetical protein [Leptospira sp.]